MFQNKNIITKYVNKFYNIKKYKYNITIYIFL